jgi:hypothetical protein
MFFGQGFTLSRNNHFMLLTLMQLICLVIFIVSNAYESDITSCMIEPYPENRLETVQDLLDSNYGIATDEGFAFIIKNNEGFKALRSKIKATDINISAKFRHEIELKRYALVSLCEVLDSDLKQTLNHELISDHFYMLPEVISWEYIRLEAAPFNPYLEKFQYLMDLSFEAGLPHMWKVFEDMDESSVIRPQHSDILDNLRLEDLYEVFMILIILHGLSMAALFGEIFYHDCLRHISVCDLINRTRQRMRKLISKSRKSVKIVVVRPRN